MSDYHAFVMNDAEVVHMAYPATPEDIVTTPDGALRATDYDGDVRILAAGTWTSVNIRKSNEEEA